ncbi:Uncharacterized [Moorella glycerini]|uniref:Uncharacterized protein n=1 Tax=Neomoorella stamsii TaxID=1266720 RepID=A0A9X7J634_9FIRM|nr:MULTISPECIES: hypothetical protein [Moorella]PRR76275.1 hypothetical protein MOST_04360 [Moorella stamsii]CEP67157.1 Uncharacterized [Moorella glycerini]
MEKFKQDFKSLAGGVKKAVKILADDSGILQWLVITTLMIGLGYWGYQRYVKDKAFNAFTETGNYLDAGVSGQ